MNASHGVMWFHLARRTKRNHAALEVTWMQNSDQELLNQHFLFHLQSRGGRRLAEQKRGKGRESEMGEEIKRKKKKKKEGKQRVGGRRGGGGGNRQEWRVIMSTLAHGAKCWNISNWISFWAVGGLKPCCLSSLLSCIPFLWDIVRFPAEIFFGQTPAVLHACKRGSIYMNIHTSQFKGSPWLDVCPSLSTHCLNTRGVHVDQQRLILTLNKKCRPEQVPPTDSRSKPTYEPLKDNPVICSTGSCSGSMCIIIFCAAVWKTAISLESKGCNVVCKEEKWASTVSIHLHLKRNTLQSLNVMTLEDAILKKRH